jgi:hypothetical protein
MTAGSGSSVAKRRSGRLRFVLFSMLVLFGGGFYTGVYATKRVIASNSDLLHRVFGVPSPVPAPVVAPTQPAAPPVAAQQTAPAQTVAATPPTTAANAATKPPVADANTKPTDTKPLETKSADTSSSSSAQTNGETSQSATSTDENQSAAHSQPAGGTGEQQSQLAKQVADYNDMLHRVQDALRHYSVVHQKSLDPKVHPADLKLFTDQENNLCTEISGAVKHAENLQDAIRADANYAALYMEGSNCAARKDVPTRLLDLDIDKLKFIDKAP